MAAMLNGAGALAFAARLLGKTPDVLEREAADGYWGPGGLVFLPYLSGERTPLDDPYARGVLFGMSETTSPRRCRACGHGGRRVDSRRRARLS